jgi:xanthine dehydrogenase accessory factor
LKGEVLHQLIAERAARRPVVLATWLESGRQVLVPIEAGDVGDAGGDAALRAAVKEAIASDSARVHELGAGPVFVQPFNPPLRLIVVGAVHIAQQLAPMAASAGYEVLVIDPRGAFARAERFPGVAVSNAWPREALKSTGLDARCAVVALCHDPKLDDPALAAALESEAFYVGALGSRRTHADRLERLRAHGFDADELGRICGPVGLDIGARSPAEIAISILAQMTQCLRRGVA